jgi:hypothetical protein
MRSGWTVLHDVLVKRHRSPIANTSCFQLHVNPPYHSRVKNLVRLAVAVPDRSPLWCRVHSSWKMVEKLQRVERWRLTAIFVLTYEREGLVSGAPCVIEACKSVYTCPAANTYLTFTCIHFFRMVSCPNPNPVCSSLINRVSVCIISGMSYDEQKATVNLLEYLRYDLDYPSPHIGCPVW